jgi:hypothetical protein
LIEKCGISIEDFEESLYTKQILRTYTLSIDYESSVFHVKHIAIAGDNLNSKGVEVMKQRVQTLRGRLQSFVKKIDELL